MLALRLEDLRPIKGHARQPYPSPLRRQRTECALGRVEMTNGDRKAPFACADLRHDPPCTALEDDIAGAVRRWLHLSPSLIVATLSRQDLAKLDVKASAHLLGHLLRLSTDYLAVHSFSDRQRKTLPANAADYFLLPDARARGTADVNGVAVSATSASMLQQLKGLVLKANAAGQRHRRHRSASHVAGVVNF
jgi:hypothetical protein